MYTLQDIAELLSLRGEEAQALRRKAHQTKLREIGDKVYLRGLIELSNRCAKDCFYCGIRRSNSCVNRYTLTPGEVLQAADFAHKAGFGSIVLQSGERQDEAFVSLVEQLVRDIMKQSGGELGITLSLGEQSEETYRRWYDAGAIRYLLRIETSNPALYARLHPADHRFEERADCLNRLRRIGYYVGSGIMIGLPFQSTEQVARDLLFLRDSGVDMVGMGPYLEHEQTPLWEYRHLIPQKEERYELNLNALAVLRLLMPKINIAATTAMGTLKSKGRQEALYTAANVIMPNITPMEHRKDYFLYQNKICINDAVQDSLDNISQVIQEAGGKISLFEQGNPLR
ncbi:MAG: [FeFe] hydrogenase H-cluster radical SAM maturase HydE [Lentimicrobiaceae bacterium]|nr:[FeFe] hydrogenase H-cluster radical SAM maturase HydE [Lentimicrobiaceae bacterium]